MKLFSTTLFVASVLAGQLALAAEVKITSYQYAGTRTRAAELCATVTGVDTFPAYIKITVDEKSEKPGIYNIVVGPELYFCTTVVTYEGTATANVWGSTIMTTSSVKR